MQIDFGINLPDGMFQGEYEDFSSMWYVDVGYQLILQMLIAIAEPHMIPLAQIIYYNSRRCWDRRCSCDKQKSRKLLQKDYEDMYVGPEFSLDSRLAQIVAFTWTTFTYSSGLPIMYIITAVNFMIIYWIDKVLLLRFYKSPKNYDEQSINFALGQCYYAFLFHFLIGSLVYSNDQILTSTSSEENKDKFRASDQSLFSLSRYNKFHVILFVVGHIFLILLTIFQQTIFNFFSKRVSCFSQI
jgi:hypothetical protein